MLFEAPFELKEAAMAEPERAKARVAKEVFMLDSERQRRKDKSCQGVRS